MLLILGVLDSGLKLTRPCLLKAAFLFYSLTATGKFLSSSAGL